MDERVTRLDQRLPVIRSRDVILAALQAAFSQTDLVGARENPYLFIREDPARSPVWITSTEGREEFVERDGKRFLITVGRGSYTPQELHLHNRESLRFADGRESYRDLGVVPLMVLCEAGSETGAEVLASMCYHILKLFRPQLMDEYDITNIRLNEVSAATRLDAVPGGPWQCIVSLRVEIEEHATMLEVANHMNRLDIDAHLTQNLTQTIASLDSTPEI